MTSSIKLNVGCGSVRPDGWINTDSSLNANLQKIPLIGKSLAKLFNKVEYQSSNMVYMNLNKKWRYPKNSVDIVYASHLFEHLSLKSADLFLNEAYRCLKSGGVIRIVVPDLYKICKRYIQEYEDGKNDAATFIMWAINMNKEGQYGIRIPFWKRLILEMQGFPHQHKFMYDERSLSAVFKQKGFIDILLMEYGDSKYINEIKDVEGNKESYLSVYLEAKKPAE